MPTHLVEMTAIWQRPLFTVKHSYGSDKKVTNMIANIAKELAKLVNQNAKLDLQHPNDFVLLEPLPTEGQLLQDYAPRTLHFAIPQKLENMNEDESKAKMKKRKQSKRPRTLFAKIQESTSPLYEEETRNAITGKADVKPEVEREVKGEMEEWFNKIETTLAREREANRREREVDRREREADRQEREADRQEREADRQERGADRRERTTLKGRVETLQGRIEKLESIFLLFLSAPSSM